MSTTVVFGFVLIGAAALVGLILIGMAKVSEANRVKKSLRISEWKDIEEEK